MLSVHLVLVIQQQVRDIWLTEIEGSAHTVMDIQFSDEIAYACHRHLNKCDVIKLCDSLNIVMCMCVCVCDDVDDTDNDDDGYVMCTGQGRREPMVWTKMLMILIMDTSRVLVTEG